MTALEKYARLEGPGVWRAGPGAQRRDVAVSLGQASLVLLDPRSALPITHWSLPAVQRLNRGSMPAVFAPSVEADGEVLELEDPLLIEALETIRTALAPRPPRRWVRLGLLGGLVALAVAGAMVLPGVLVNRTAAIIPLAARAQIGRDALESLTLGGGALRLCASPDGRQSLTLLRNRLLGSDWRVMVLAGLPGFQAAHLPGRLIVLGDDLVARLDSGEALAGWIMAEALAHDASDPLLDALTHAGTRATATLLTTGALPEGALHGYAQRRFARAPALPEAEGLARALAPAGIGVTAYALSLDDSRSALRQALADLSTPAARAQGRILTDGEWLMVQAICLQ